MATNRWPISCTSDSLGNLSRDRYLRFEWSLFDANFTAKESESLKMLLLVQENEQKSGFYLSADKGDITQTELILNSVDELCKLHLIIGWFSHLLNQQASEAYSQYAAARNIKSIPQPNKDILRGVLKSLSDEQKVDLYNTDGILHTCVLLFHNDRFQIMLKALQHTDSLYQVLSFQEECFRLDPLHYAIKTATKNSHGQNLRLMLKSVGREMRFQMLKRKLFGCTLLSRAVQSGQSTAVDLILRSVNNEQRFQLLNIQDWYKYTPLQKAVQNQDCAVIEKIKQNVTNPVQWLALLTRPIPEHWSLHEGCTGASNMLTELKIKAKIYAAINACGDFDKQLQIQCIIEEEPLTKEQIVELSIHSERYVVPHKQNHCRIAGIILYNTCGRHGADEEASNFKQTLESIGASVIKMEWMDTIKLQNTLDIGLSQINDFESCSLLFVCVMSHGRRGVLKGSNDSEISINSLLKQVTDNLPRKLPLVMVIQACQLSPLDGMDVTAQQDESLDAPVPHRTEDPHYNKHIVLTRPHTVLMLATVTGGEAIRGAFTGALAHQILESDGKIDIGIVFDKAVRKMKKDEPLCSEQWPELRKVTDKSLFLPPASNQAIAAPIY